MAEHPALVQAARTGLPVRGRPPIHVAGGDANSVLAVARMDRIAGLLCTAIDSGDVRATKSLRDQVADVWQRQLVASVVNEAQIVRVADVLESSGVEWRLTKGSAVSHLDYPDPSLRTFGDVDIIVHPHSWSQATSELTRSGWQRVEPEVHPGFEARFGKGFTMNSTEELELDVHRRLAIGRFGLLLPTEALFCGSTRIELADREVPVLDGSQRLIHACFHSTLGGFRRLRAHRDVAQMLLVSEVDWIAAVRLAETHRVGAVLAQAVIDSWATLDLEAVHPMHDWAVKCQISGRDARALRVFTEERPFRAQALTGLPVLVGRGASSYLYALAVQRGRDRRGVRQSVAATPRLLRRVWRRMKG